MTLPSYRHPLPRARLSWLLSPQISLPGFELCAWPLWLLVSIMFVEVTHVMCGSSSFSVQCSVWMYHDVFIHFPVGGHLGCRTSLYLFWCIYLVYFYSFYTLKYNRNAKSSGGVHKFSCGRCHQIVKRLYRFPLPSGICEIILGIVHLLHFSHSGGRIVVSHFL